MESLDEVCQSFPILYLWLQYKIFDTQKNIKREETKKKSKRLYDKRLYKVENIVTTIKISHTEYDKREKNCSNRREKRIFFCDKKTDLCFDTEGEVFPRYKYIKEKRI